MVSQSFSNGAQKLSFANGECMLQQVNSLPNRRMQWNPNFETGPNPLLPAHPRTAELSAPNEFSNNCVASSKLPATGGQETCSSMVWDLHHAVICGLCSSNHQQVITSSQSRVAIISVVFCSTPFRINLQRAQGSSAL